MRESMPSLDMPKPPERETPTPVAAPAPVVPPKPDPKPEPAAKTSGVLDEAREKLRKEAIATILGGKTPANPPATKPPVAAAPATEPAKPDATNDSPAPEPKKPRRVAPRPDIDPGEIAAKAAEGATRAALDSVRSKDAPAAPPAPKKEDFSGLPEDVRRKLPVLQKMAELNPDKYGNIVEEIKSYTGKEEAYVAQWEKEHPGEEFDAEDKSHDAWYAKHKPEYSPDDYEDARVEIRMEPKLKKLAEENQSYRERVEASERQAKIKPMVEGLAADASKQIATAINKEFTDPEKLQSDPVAQEIVQNVSRSAAAHIDTLAGLMSTTVKYDDTNPQHRYLYDFAVDLDQRIKALPASETTSDGKRFATQDEWANMSDAQRRSHWKLGIPEISSALTNRFADHAVQHHSQETKRLEEMAKRLGYVKNGAHVNAPKPNATPAAKPSDLAPQSAPSPSHVPGAVSTNGAPSVASNQPAWMKTILG